MTDNPEETKNLPAPVKPHIPIKNGQLVPQDAAGLFYLASMMSKTSMVPDNYRGDPHSTFVAIQLGMEVGLRPMQALQNIAVIKGKPTIYADGITGLLHGSGKCEYINEWFEAGGEKVDPSDLDQDPGEWPNNLKAVSEIKRQGSAQQLYRGTFSVSDARRMGTWNSKDVWKKHPARMLMWRARTYAARDGFSDVLKGLGVFEEVIDYDADLENQNGHYSVPEEVIVKAEEKAREAEKVPEKSLFEEMCENQNIDYKLAMQYCNEIHKVTGAPVLTITLKAAGNPGGFVEKFKTWVSANGYDVPPEIDNQTGNLDDGDPMGIDEDPEPELSETTIVDDPPVHGPDDVFQDPPAPVIDEDGFSADMEPEKKAEVQSTKQKSTIKKWIGLRGVDFKDYVPANPGDFEGISNEEYKKARDKWDNLVKKRFDLEWPLGSSEKQPEIEFPKQNMRQHLAEMEKDYPDEVKKSMEKRKFAKGGLSEDAAKIVVQDVIDILGGKQIQ